MGKWEMASFDDVLHIVNGKNQKQVEDSAGSYPIYGSGGIMGYANDFLCEGKTVIIGRKGTINKPIYVDNAFWNVDTAFGLRPNEKKLFPKFLFYFCNNFNFEVLNTTVTIPSLTKANLLRVQMPLPPLDVQRKIADVLDRAAALIEKRKVQIEKLDLLVKSRFVEMFGDPMTNPKRWDTIKWDALFDTTTGKLDSNAMVENGAYPFFTCSKEVFFIDTYAFDCEALLLAGNNAAGIYDVKHYSGKFNAYQRTYVITLKNRKFNLYPYRIMLEQKLMEMRNLSKGTNTKYLTMGILNDFIFLAPPIELQRHFTNFCKKIEKYNVVLTQSLKKMTNNYNSLVQKCFRGEIF